MVFSTVENRDQTSFCLVTFRRKWNSPRKSSSRIHVSLHVHQRIYRSLLPTRRFSACMLSRKGLMRSRSSSITVALSLSREQNDRQSDGQLVQASKLRAIQPSLERRWCWKNKFDNWSSFVIITFESIRKSQWELVRFDGRCQTKVFPWDCMRLRAVWSIEMHKHHRDQTMSNWRETPCACKSFYVIAKDVNWLVGEWTGA